MYMYMYMHVYIYGVKRVGLLCRLSNVKELVFFFLQYEEGDMYEHFRSFYDDVFPEFTTAGKIAQFKVRGH